MVRITNLVTGAFSFTGKYITKLLLKKGERVITITNKPLSSSPFGKQVKAFPYSFDEKTLIRILRGVKTLYNTYWIRFEYGNTTFKNAVENTKILIESAVSSGVERIVHSSIVNADKSELPYFKGKAKVEKLIKRSGLSYAILRPAVIFGREDILINNIAWFLRHFPAFPIFGDGKYKVRPIYVKDFAKIAVDAGHKKRCFVLDAVGEPFNYKEMVRLIKNKIRSNSILVHIPIFISPIISKIANLIVNDIVLTKDEIIALTKGLLYSRRSRHLVKTSITRLSEWLENNKDLGMNYHSELKRHYNL